jgi:hypothetical protein
MAKYPKEKKQKEMEEDNKVHESKSPEQILKELIDAYAKDKTVKKPVPSISQFEQGKFRRKTQPYQGEKPEKAEKSEQVQKNIGLPLMMDEKAEDKKYPKKLGSKNVEAHMKRLKEEPSKYPGGKKQAIAIGLSQAREGTKEPMPKAKLPKAEIEKAGEMPAGAAKPKMPKMPKAPAMPSKQPIASAQKQAQASASGKQMMPKMPKSAAPKKQAAPSMATKSDEKIAKNQFVITEAELNSKCTDCNKPQFTLTKNEHKFTPCICYASENQSKEPFVKLIKSEGNTKLYFNSKADPESVKSFLLTLKLGLLAKKISK